MSLLDKKATVKEPVAEGNYELKLTNITEKTNEKGGYVQLTFKSEDGKIEIIHTIFGSNDRQIEYTIQTLAQQLEMYGEDISLKDVLVLNHIYKIYVSYNEYGRNIAFGVRRETPENLEEVL